LIDANRSNKEPSRAISTSQRLLNGLAFVNRRILYEEAKKLPEEEEERKLPAADIRGVSEDDIVKITLTKTLENLSVLLEEESPDNNDLRRVIDRLKNLNRWAFNEDETVSSSLTSSFDFSIPL